jgi:NTP pyrophosphatase (non-canonical NTP hydrolase)
MSGYDAEPNGLRRHMDLKELVDVAFNQAKDKGFHDNDDKVTFGDRIALIHTELSEALEAFRVVGLEGVQCNYQRLDEGKKPEGVPSELADVVIRVADLCGTYGIDLQSAVKEKLAYNRTREYRHGGKKL